MTAIALPDSIVKNCTQLENENKNEKAFKHFLKTKAFSDAILNHKKSYPDTELEEYTEVLEVLLSFYKAGQTVNINELATAANESILNTGRLEAERTVTRNAIRESFIPLLRDTGLITGNKPMTWAYLDTLSPVQKLLNISRSWYAASLEKTPAEIQFQQERRNNMALRKVEQIALDNRGIQDDIRHHLDYIAKEDKKCRELAHQLGIPYSKAKEDVMKKRKKADSNDLGKKYGFVVIVGIVLLAGFLINAGKTGEPGAQVYQNSMIEQSETDNGLSVQENIWRDRYIEIYNLDTMTPAQKEQEMLMLSGEYMIPMARIQEIIAGIDKEELQ